MGVSVRAARITTRKSLLRPPVLLAVLVILVLLCPGCQVDATAQPRTFDSSIATSEPADVTAFLAALENGDLESADDIALPTYRAEWERRGVTRADRRLLQSGTPTRMVFNFAGGVLDDAGFGHYLYVAILPTRWHLQQTAPSVWRVDTDPYSRVIWAEMVYLFSSATSVTTSVGDAVAVKSPPEAGLGPLEPSTLIHIKSDTTPEGFDAVRLGGANPPTGMSVDGKTLVFYSVSELGDRESGNWSYGEPVRSTPVVDDEVSIAPVAPTTCNSRSARVRSCAGA